MKKSERVEKMVQGMQTDDGELDPCYAGWFTCFNRGDYYEAHDVLEHLWLQTKDGNHRFYKGLIQLAGAFVHLKKQHARPGHPKDGARLRPAGRLFALAIGNLSDYRPTHLRLDVSVVCQLCAGYTARLEEGKFETNPWRPEAMPRIGLMLPVQQSSRGAEAAACGQVRDRDPAA